MSAERSILVVAVLPESTAREVYETSCRRFDADLQAEGPVGFVRLFHPPEGGEQSVRQACELLDRAEVLFGSCIWRATARPWPGEFNSCTGQPLRTTEGGGKHWWQ